MPRDHDSVSSPLHWFPEYVELGSARLRKQSRLLGLALVTGVVAGIGAIVFFCACDFVSHYVLGMLAGYAPAGPGGEPHIFKDEAGDLKPWMLLILPTIGGIISGFLVYTFAPEAEGHGTDSAIDAYHRKQGYIRPVVPVIKIVTSAITLGTGGSGGREGPIAQTGAGFGSLVAGAMKLRPTDRRVLMAAGMAAGIAAIFKAPLAGALFASEVLYRSPDFESEVIIPAGLASCTAYVTFGSVFGYQSLFNLPAAVTQQLGFDNPAHLFSYLVLALCMAVLAMIYTRTFYGLTYLFHRLKIVPHLKPAIGAFLNGAVGLLLYFGFKQDPRVLSVLSFGYSTLQDAIQFADANTNLYFGFLLLAVSLGKILTTGLTIGSGGSGGVFGPSMVIGGCGAGAIGIFMHELWAPLCPSPSTFVIVGMAGFFAAAAKTPISTLVIVSEMTGNYQLLLPTLWVCAIAFLVSDEQSLYRSQVESRSLSPAHQGDYIRDVLTGMQVRQFLTPKQDVPLLRPDDSLPAVLAQLSGTNYHAIPVVDDEAMLLGVVSLEEVYLASQSPNLAGLVLAADLMRTDITPLRPDDRIDRALELFVESDLLALPVVEGVEVRRVVGIVKRADVSSTYLRFVQGEGGDTGSGI